MDALWVLWLFIALAVACGIWGFAIERYLFTIRRESVAVLPEGSQSIKVLHVSDFHLAPWQNRKKKFIKGLEQLEPDLVINTGDNLGHMDSIETAIKSTEGIRKFAGVFVNGSNDYHAPEFRNPFTYLAHPSERSHGKFLDTKKLTSAFEESGWLNLNNRSGILEINGNKIGFIGLDDPHEGLADLGSIKGQQRKVAAADFVIGVSHAPYMNVLEALANAGAEMTFAGHTHGGQVCLPFKGALVTNCDLPTHAAKGLSAWMFNGRGMLLNVCAGLGTSIFAPVRFFCKPEVRLIELLPRS